MPVHSLPKGRALIEALAQLGSSLGYAVEQELPVEHGRTNPPAVDVAWLGEKGQIYPLMIFEVESQVTNSAANNAVKVFGQANERFERPLFFFHVFMSGAAETSRIETLRMQFGLHNYRVYRLDQNDSTRLVNDVLSQHRRVRRVIHVPTLFSALIASTWQDLDLNAVLDHLETLRFEGNLLADYARTAGDNAFLKERFLRLLLSTIDDPIRRRRVAGYDSYFGAQWADPLHIALLSLTHPDDGEWLERLRYWQERTSFATMIGPHFGLSRDYDEFIYGCAPVLLALIAALMHKVKGGTSYVLEQYRVLLDAMVQRPPTLSFFTAIWMLHVAAAARDGEAYEYARVYVNGKGGASPSVLFDPPSLVSFDEPDQEWHSAMQRRRRTVPDLDEFRRRVRKQSIQRFRPEDELAKLVLNLLSDDRAMYKWSAVVRQALHSLVGTNADVSQEKKSGTPSVSVR